MVEGGTQFIFGDEHVLDVQLIPLEVAEGIVQVGRALPQGFDLSPREHDPGFKGLDEVKFKAGPTVDDLQNGFVFLFHGSVR